MLLGGVIAALASLAPAALIWVLPGLDQGLDSRGWDAIGGPDGVMAPCRPTRMAAARCSGWT